jgi:transmembrane sensor
MSESRWLADAQDPGLHGLRQALDEATPHLPSEARRRRVWAALASRPAPRPRWPWLAGACALGVAAAAVALVHFGTTPVITAEPLPSVLNTKAGETVARVLPGGAEVVLADDATLALDRGEAPVVQRGRVGFHVPHQAPGHRFAVRAGRVEVRVVGTRFEVTRGRDGVTVAVSEGVVEVWTPIDAAPRLAARLHAGERWREAPDEAPAVAPADPHAQVAPVTSPRRERRRVSRTAAIVGPAERSLESARAASPTGALGLYRRLADGTGATAENALYELGEIYRDRLGQPQRGLEIWREYRRRFPHGLLRAEVDVSLIETLAMTGARREALQEASTFLRQNPESERRHEVARVAGDLARAGGDCRAAVPLYERAIDGSGTSRDADDAAFARVACLDELVDRRVEAAAGAYLTRFPEGRHVSAARAFIEDARRRR